MASMTFFQAAIADNAASVSAATDSSKAIPFDPTPHYQNADSYSTTNPFNGDDTDIYYPSESGVAAGDLPVVLLLQGALVDKSFYSNYASQVARYGFAVVVPNHFQDSPNFGRALLSEKSQLQAVLDQMNAEVTNPTSPLNSKVRTQQLGLLGHSFGAAVGLSSIGNLCLPELLCFNPTERPKELASGAFFGANLRDRTEVFLPIENNGIGIALIQDDLDGVALPLRAEKTYAQIQAPPKALFSLSGVNHFGITNINNPKGAFPDSNNPTVEQAVSIEAISRWSGLFLRGTLLEDAAALDYLQASTDSG